eukprot:TRINITY_DN5006_c0_g1_i1.p1 TRINITY_DN5006_c0_g1~~TRINITY_DN5006_c0_g1_i1.p1  ORF type:complete len:1384 (+),score=493.36 TRINITY_DN5006_c0_g1_i1:130-4152(+)
MHGGDLREPLLPEDADSGEDLEVTQQSKEMRQFEINNYEENSGRFCNNQITRSKYNLNPFTPRFAIWRNLWEQFHRYANIYFLVVASLQLIPGLSPTGRYTTLVPLAFVLFVTFLKDSYEDYKRHVNDSIVNNQEAKVWRDGPVSALGKERSGDWKKIAWKNVCVGDFVEVPNREKENFFPADLLLLHVETEDDRDKEEKSAGQCHIETQNLDGETNLKLRRSHSEPAAQTSPLPAFNPQDPAQYRGTLACKPPDDDLYRFEGWLERREEVSLRCIRANIDINSILLRGSRLAGGAKGIIGVVVYTGNDTKLMKNQKDAEHKSSRLERVTNRQIMLVFAVLLVLCAISATLLGIQTEELSAHWYLDPGDESPVYTAVVGIGTFLILFNNLIPISLYVSMEIVKLVQAKLIESDIEIYAPELPAAKANTSSLNEELGQVQYIFSDKTGTLTCNIMDFLKFSVGEKAYGTGTTEIGRAAAAREGRQIHDDRPHDAKVSQEFCFWDEDISDVERKGENWRWMDQPNWRELEYFFRILAVCHSVVWDKQREEYQAQSPDEKCLVIGVKHLGVIFRNRVRDECRIRVHRKGGEYDEESWKVEQMLDFTSDRKRMSTICIDPRTKKRMLFCKGADTVLFERMKKNLSAAEADLYAVTKNFLTRFAADGLRTLVVAKRELDTKEYEKWAKKYVRASENVGDREKMVAECAEEIERDLELVGTTAIEDKLQKGVPATIELLRFAGVQIWVLTGDKQETAINIGYACALLHNDMGIFSFDDSCNTGNISQILQNYARDAEQVKRDYGQELGIVVQGSTLLMILGGKGAEVEPRPENSLYFLNIAKHCKAVICCRVTPGQKAQVVRLVKRNLDKVTLAIGDGANDVSMIGEAHVGVGISGLEGLQAARAADYAISQFRFLQRLLLVHGRWSYRRTSRLILYSFYKNICLYLTQFWFCLFNAWSGQSLYDSWALSMFNVVFTFLPIMFIAVLDRDVEPERLVGWEYAPPASPDGTAAHEPGWERFPKTCPGIEQFPELYNDGRKGRLFDTVVFWKYMGTALWHSAVCFFVPVLSLRSSADASGASPTESDGAVLALPTHGLTGYTAVVFVVTFKVALETSSWTYMNHVVTWGSLLSWFIFLFLYCGVIVLWIADSLHWYLIFQALGNPQVWLAVLLSTVLAMSRDFVWKALGRSLSPRLAHKIQEWEQRRDKDGKKVQFDRRMLKREAPQLFPRQMVKQFKLKKGHSEPGAFGGGAAAGRGGGAAVRVGGAQTERERLDVLAAAQLTKPWAAEYVRSLRPFASCLPPPQQQAAPPIDLPPGVLRSRQGATHMGRMVQRPPALGRDSELPAL